MFIFSGAYWEYYLMGIILLPGILLAIYAQAKVTKNFNKYSKVMSMRGTTGAELARNILREEGLEHIQVIKAGGNGLSDHYNPRKKEIALSEDVYNSSSLAALGVAAHEVGHAIQYKENYIPVKLRSALVPITNVVSSMLWPLVFMGLFLNFGAETGGSIGAIFVWAGIALFGLAVILNLITLPVEFDASRRAGKLLLSTGTIDEMEIEGAKKVLNAAALTYVAALLVSILNLVRFLLVANNRD